MMLFTSMIAVLPLFIAAKPSQLSQSFSASYDGPKPLLSFDNGNVGVNFLGFRASAGLGGLLNGNLADGGLHAEAGTPFGQSAGAGLGGTADSGGRTAGGLYAGATAGGGVAAGAGLAGSAGSSGVVGATYAGSSSGDIETHIAKIPVQQATSGKFTASVVAPARYHKDVEIIEEQPLPRRTYVERTVIPNYEEKVIQVPSYVEKTIRVPTTVEKTIRVPAAPTIIEKTVAAPPAELVGVVEESRVIPAQHSTVHFKNIGFRGFGGAGSYGENAGGYGAGGASTSYTASVRKAINPQVVNDIFNIPISTLGAVSKLVGGLAGRASGSLSVSKSYGASTYS